MRDIKFRAFDTKENCRFDCWCLHCNGHYKQNNDDYGDIPQNIHIMQYTGLKDKNGKEIYDGDIVECSQKGQTMSGSIIYREGGYFWEFQSGQYSFANEAINKWKGEVIGNIYQNSSFI